MASPTEVRRKGFQGLANTALSASSEALSQGRRTWLTHVFVVYSANVAVTVTVTLNSGLGAAYDVRLGTIELVAQRYGKYVCQDGVPLPIFPGDVIDVSAPAGGAGVTATVVILTEEQDMYEASGVGYYHGEQKEGV